MTFGQDLSLAELLVGDVVAIAEGQPVSDSKTIDGATYNATVVKLPSGPTQGANTIAYEGTSYQIISGGIWSIFSIALGDAAAFTSGIPVAVAEKVRSDWYGTSLSRTTPAATSV